MDRVDILLLDRSS